MLCCSCGLTWQAFAFCRSNLIDPTRAAVLVKAPFSASHRRCRRRRLESKQELLDGAHRTLTELHSRYSAMAQVLFAAKVCMLAPSTAVPVSWNDLLHQEPQSRPLVTLTFVHLL